MEDGREGYEVWMAFFTGRREYGTVLEAGRGNGTIVEGWRACTAWLIVGC